MPAEEKLEIKAFEQVYSNVTGSMMHQSLGRSKYFATVLDSYNGCSLVRFINRTSEAENEVIERIRELENQLNSKVYKLTTINPNSVK